MSINLQPDPKLCAAWKLLNNNIFGDPFDVTQRGENMLVW
jgi:hypothetical protein